MNRGSSTGRVRHGLPGRGFNEAPIHESGKFGRSWPSDPTPSRFNEAPIHESGK